MATLEQYVQLYMGKETEIQLGKPYEMSLQHISDTLFCTLRNSKLIIKKMEELEWITWSPGKGRGNRSSINFLQHPERLIFTISQELVKQGKMKQAEKVIESYKTLFNGLPVTFNAWIHTLFGYHVENNGYEQQDVLRLRMDIGTICFDPLRITLRSECHFMKHVCDTLVRFNSETNTIEPHIAFHWETNSNQLEWTFYIRKGIIFHDGKKLDAYDILYTFERFVTYKENSYKWLLENVESMHVVHTYCFKIKIKRPNALLLHFLSDEHVSILSKDSYLQHLEKSVIGTGPFQVIRNDDEMLILQAHEYHFRERAFLDRIEIWNMEDSDLSFGMTINDTEDASWRHHMQKERNVSYISLNANRMDKYLRNALQQIIDRDKLIHQLGDFRGEKTRSFLSFATWNERNEEVEKLLEKSKYNGRTLSLYSYKDRDHRQDCKWIQEECQKYGIIVEPKFLDVEELLETKTLKEADLIHESATIDEKVEISFLHLLLSENAPVYHHLHSSMHDIVKIRIDKLLGMEKTSSRNALLVEIEKMLVDEGNILPLYRHDVHIDHHEMVQNVQLNAQGWIDFRHLWFKKQ
jgi:MarR-like DNA-binding transcriptional regulator SgrR of sgrS sRNA